MAEDEGPGHKSIDFRTLRYIAAAAEYGSLRKGASSLGVQTSTLSRQIRTMEDRLGVALFERRRSGLTLTTAGVRLVGRLRAIFDELDSALFEAQNAGRAETGELSISFYPSLAGGQLRILLQAFSRERADIRCLFSEAPPSDQLAALKARSVDAAFLMAVGHSQQFESVPLWNERLHIALPEDHILAKSDVLTWQHIRSEPFIIRKWRSGAVVWYRLAERMIADGIEPNVIQHDVSREALLGLVGAGYGLTIVSDAATAIAIPGVVYRPIDDPQAMITIRLAWMPENDNPALARFVGFAKSFILDRKTGPERGV